MQAAGATFASVWLPSGQLDQGSETTVVVREARFAPNGRMIRAMRAEHSGQIDLGDSLVVDYGAAYVAAGIGEVTRDGAASRENRDASFAALECRVLTGKRARVVRPSRTRPLARVRAGHARYASRSDHEQQRQHPRGQLARGICGEARRGGARQLRGRRVSRLLSAHGGVWLRWRRGLRNGWPANSNAARLCPRRRRRQHLGHQAGLPADAFFQRGTGRDLRMGRRIGPGQRCQRQFGPTTSRCAADALPPQRGGAACQAKVPRARTEIAASYKWIDGTVVSRQDLFGEAAFGLDPNLSLAIRQPLPSFGSIGQRHWEAVADFRNLLAQGYVPVNSQGGQLVLVPVLRSFRGGVSFQF